MRPLRRRLARLAATFLVVAASLPGQLQLVHEHAGGDHVHVHADAEALAAHDLFADHQHSHDAAHSHAHAEPQHKHPHTAGVAGDGPEYRAVGTFHVHGLNPFHQVTCPALAGVVACTAIARARVTVAAAPRAVAHDAARSRGPPAQLVG